MRTTLTLDDDVAAALHKRHSERGTRWRDEVNEVLRAGLVAVSEPAAHETEYTLPTFDPGRQLMETRSVTELLDAEDIERGMPART